MSSELPGLGSEGGLVLQTDYEDELLESAYKNYLRHVLKEAEMRILIPKGEQCFCLIFSNEDNLSARVYARSATNTEPITATLKAGSMDPIYDYDDIPVIYGQVGSALIPLVRFHAVEQTAFSRVYNRLPIKGLVDLLRRDSQNTVHYNGILYYRSVFEYRAMKS